MLDVEERTFFSRYPGFLFMLQIHTFTVPRIEELYDNTEKEMQRFTRQLKVSQADTAYVFGLGLGYHYDAAKEWLIQSQQHTLIFIEHDLGVLELARRHNRLDYIFSNRQVHLAFLLDRKNTQGFVEEVGYQFPSPKVVVLGLEAYKKQYRSHFIRIRDRFTRQSVIAFAQHQEKMHYIQLFRNMLPNFLRLGEASSVNKMGRCLEGVPAVIVGAGPSLERSIQTVKSLRNKACIFAGGSAITALEHYGIKPHIGLAVDPNPEEFLRFSHTRFVDLPMLFAPRLIPTLFEIFRGPHGYLQTETGGKFEAWMEKNLGIEGGALLDSEDYEALSVTIVAIKTAIHLGCNPIVFCGLDLAYTDGKRYPDDVVPDDILQKERSAVAMRTGENLLIRQGRKNTRVVTARKWLMEGTCIEGIIRRYPKIQFIDATECGLRIKRARCISIDILERDWQVRFPLLEQHIAETMRQTTFGFAKKDIHASLLVLKESVQRCISALEQLVTSSEIPSILFTLDLSEEVAYEVFFEQLEIALRNVLRTDVDNDDLMRKKMWEHMLEVGREYLSIFHEYGVI